MAKAPRSDLSDSAIQAAAPRDKIWKLADSLGLYVAIHPSGTKTWRLKYRFGGKEKSLALGSYPEIGPKEARVRRDVARSLLADGVDPGAVRKEERIAKRVESERLKGAMRFTLDNTGALSIRLGTRAVNLNTEETSELRTFLDATRAVTTRN